MLLSAVSVLVVAQSSSEIQEGLMDNPVHYDSIKNTQNRPLCTSHVNKHYFRCDFSLFELFYVSSFFYFVLEILKSVILFQDFAQNINEKCVLCLCCTVSDMPVVENSSQPIA